MHACFVKGRAPSLAIFVSLVLLLAAAFINAVSCLIKKKTEEENCHAGVGLDHGLLGWD